MTEHFFQHKGEFILESNEVLKDIQIVYHTAGTLNKEKNNVIWVCHALTANSDVADWWPNMVGEGLPFDTSKYFIVCANFLGSCYGTTGPLSINPETQKPYYHDFPLVTIRDMVNAHELLRQHLGISKIFLLTGGSIGSFQVLEWSIMNADAIETILFIASAAFASPWNIAFNESQRMALKADPTFHNGSATAGEEGLKAARSIALLSYRNANTYNKTQYDPEEKLEDYRATSYQQYQGDKLVKRFNAYSYFSISKSFDSHNVGRNRGGLQKALSKIKAKSVFISVSSDILFFPSEIKEIHTMVSGSEYFEIESLYGHDGFLIETKKLTKIINTFLN